MREALPRVAGAPITWGVCEVPGWGCQLGRDRVLEEAAGLGLRAIELGPRGFLPDEPRRLKRALRHHQLELAAGFVPAVLHRREMREEVMRATAAAADTLAGAGATVMVLAAELGNGGGYDRSAELSDVEWSALLDGLSQIRGIGASRGLEVALHPHYGTAVERAHHVERVLAGTDVPLCLDTGHLVVGGADPAEIARLAAGRIAHVHLKDVDAALAERVRRGELGYREAVGNGLYRPLGDGDAEIGRVLALLAAGRYDGWYVLEHDVVLAAAPPPGEGPVTAARRSLDYFHRSMDACA